ncbi:MAG: histidine--tRNA ligase [Candidatus Kapabacteria bacterium]|nr:histidine--tRNA ligase [Candidatus Kapabacteria bacterium]
MSISVIRGMRDIFGAEIEHWHRAESIFRSVADGFAYEEFRTPLLESTDLFKRGVGQETDIVGKEMYTFEDRGGDSVTLRPEMTAPIVRACIEHNLVRHNPTQRLWYYGPQFRYDRPQKGRYRQFHQFGAECIGSANPEADVEIILLASETLRRFGVTRYRLEINSLGTADVRTRYRQALVEFLTERSSELSEDSKRRMQSNPLRVLDSKDEADRRACQGAPSLMEYFDQQSADHFAAVRALLDVAGIEYDINPRLVRGLDYYNHTVFEFTTDALGTQNAIGGGGRYDPLFTLLGGGDVPAVGFSIGVERMILLWQAEHGDESQGANRGVYLVSIGDEARLPVQLLALRLRRAGIHVVTDVLRRSVKSQMKDANRAGVAYTVMIGDTELASSTAVVKNMLTGTEETVAQTDIETLVRAHD